MQFIERYTINGNPLPVPDAEVEESYEDLDAADSGRTEDGVLHRSVTRYKVGKWSFHYRHLTSAEKQYIESLFPDTPDFQFGHPDRLDPSQTKICRAYRAKYGVAVHNLKTGTWKNYKFSIIEC